MASLDSLRHLTLGQYAPGHSRVHLLDPRAKLVALALLTVAVVVSSWWGATLALVALIGAAYAVAGLSRRHVASSLRPVWPVLGMLAFFQLLFGSGVDEALAGNVLLVSWGVCALGRAAVRRGRLAGPAGEPGALGEPADQHHHALRPGHRAGDAPPPAERGGVARA